MFCPKCGQQIPDDSRFCPKCGNATAPQAAPPPQPQPVYQAPPQPVYQQPVYQQPVYAAAVERTSGMSVTALIMGILGFFLAPLSVLAIIFGGVGMAQTGKDPYLKGKGMAVAGLILGIINIVLWIALWFWIGSWFWWLF